uniref:Uncharacterized protein n=2 Tax=Oryza TaxID=4527 RepID=A0A0E0ITS9_ORYNI
MDNNGGGSAPISSKRSCLFVDITNVINAKLTNKHAAVIQSEINVPKDRENYQQINKNSTSKIQRASTIGFGNENNASVIRHVRLPCTDKAELSYGTPNMHEDVTNLSTAELKRKRARERYASLTKELKEDGNKKRRDSRKRRKDESIGFYKLTHLLLSKFGLFEHNTLLLLN